MRSQHSGRLAPLSRSSVTRPLYVCLPGAAEVALLDREPLALQCALLSAAASGVPVQPQSWERFCIAAAGSEPTVTAGFKGATLGGEAAGTALRLQEPAGRHDRCGCAPDLCCVVRTLSQRQN